MNSRISRYLCLIILLWMIALSAVQLGKHYSLQTGGRDLGLFDHPLSSTIHGRFLQSSLLPDTARNYFGFHFCPVILMFVPFYALFDGAEVLLVGHVILLGLSAIPLFAITRRLTNERWAFLLTLIYLLYRPLTRVAACSYHQESFFPFFLFMAVYAAMIQRSRIWTWIWIALCLLTKEDVSIYFLPVAALLMLTKEYRRTGAILGVTCVVYFIAVNQFILPVVSEGGSTEWPEHYRGYGETPMQIAVHAATHPFQLLQDAFSPQTLRIAGAMLVMLGGIPLLSPVSLGALTPAVACFLSTLEIQHTLGLYYSATVFPYLFLGAAWGLRNLSTRISAGQHRWITMYLGVLIIANAANSSFIKWSQPSKWTHTGRAAEARSVLDAIPENASVEMQNCLIPHVRPSERDIGIFPEKPDAEYIAIFHGADPWPLTKDEFEARIKELSEDPGLKIVKSNGSCFLYQRTGAD